MVPFTISRVVGFIRELLSNIQRKVRLLGASGLLTAVQFRVRVSLGAVTFTGAMIDPTSAKYTIEPRIWTLWTASLPMLLFSGAGHAACRVPRESSSKIQCRGMKESFQDCLEIALAAVPMYNYLSLAQYVNHSKDILIQNASNSFGFYFRREHSSLFDRFYNYLSNTMLMTLQMNPTAATKC